MTSPGAKPRKTPCASCPYRKNVPSGVWDETEYAKLKGYDGETFEQSPAAFHCHQQDGTVCSGWLGHRDPYQLLAVRLGVSAGTLDVSCIEYTTPVPLFETGEAAAKHGMKDIKKPGKRAQEFMKKIITKKGNL